MNDAYERRTLVRLDKLIRLVDVVSGAPVTTLECVRLLAGVARVELRREEASVLVLNARGPLDLQIEATGYVPLTMLLRGPPAKSEPFVTLSAALTPAPGALLPASASYLLGRIFELSSGRSVSNATVEIRGLPPGACSKFRSLSGGYFLAVWPAGAFAAKGTATRALHISAWASPDGRKLATRSAVNASLVAQTMQANTTSWRAAGLVSIGLSDASAP
jgi:hypothetical protein